MLAMERNVYKFGSKNLQLTRSLCYFLQIYEGWNFNSGNYLFTTDTK